MIGRIARSTLVFAAIAHPALPAQSGGPGPNDGVSGTSSTKGGGGGGAPARVCNEGNPRCTKGIGNGNLNHFALEMPIDKKNKVVQGFSIYTRAPAGSKDVAIALYFGDPQRNGPTGAPKTTGIIKVGKTIGWYQGTFTKPHAVPAGQRYYLQFDNAGIDHPVCALGQETTTHYWRLPIMPNWIGPFSSRAWAYREECTGGSTPGRIVKFGTGCAGNGVGPRSRLSPNLPCSNPVTAEWKTVMALEVAPSKRSITVTAAGIMTSSSSARNLAFNIHDELSSGGPGSKIASGTIRVGTITGVYTGPLNKTLVVAPNKKIYIAFDSTGIAMPMCIDQGRDVQQWIDRGTYWAKSAGGPWAYRLIATGDPDSIPELIHSGLPGIGQTMIAVLRYGLAGAPAAVMLGTSATKWNGVPLPFDLGPLGAPDCNVYVAGDAILGGKVAANGELRQVLKFPQNNFLVGKEFFMQGIVLDTRANKLGIATTNALVGRIGL